MLCQKCLRNQARIDPTYGVIFCTQCEDKLSSLPSPSHQVEFTTDSIRYQRKAYKKDIIQPYRSGELSKEYIQQFGPEATGATPKEIKKAKNVWKGDI